MQLHKLTISEAHSLLKKKEISSKELTCAVLDRINAVEKDINAYITVTGESAIKEAEKADRAIASGNITPLTGIPLSIKDLICTKDIKTTCASKILENFIPPYDATVIKKLKKAGAVIVGKVNMDEFAMGSSTENSGFKTTRNPWNLKMIPGGSSGGSAASVAADMCLGSLGSDTGGSIRQPASHCGVVGLKPTYGRVSRFGLIAFASSLDQIGPISSDVTDCAILLNAISGYDPKDSTSVKQDAVDFTRSLKKDLKGVVVGIPKENNELEGIDPEISKKVADSAEVFKSLGATCKSVSLPHIKYAVAAYYVIATSEASSNLARYDGVKYGFRDTDKTNLIEMYKSTRSKGFGDEVKRRILLGTYALSAGYYDAYYKKASQVRTLIIEDYKNAFKQCDFLISPVTPSTAFEIGEKKHDPLLMYLSDIFTLSANMAGITGISVPCGFSSNNLPIGLQIQASHFMEEKILNAAYKFEQATDYHIKKPVL